MKTFKLFSVALALLTMSFADPEGRLTDAERRYAVNLLQETRKELLKKVKDLTSEQLNFKADAASWSIAECVEHIAISENNFYEFVQMALKEEADPQQKSEVKFTDEAIVKMITDRSQKVKTTETFVPTGRYGSFEATLNEFKTKRDKHIEYLKTTTDDLRNHYNNFPFGKIDAYQTLLFMGGHSKRHTDQIQEIMEHPDFPDQDKKGR